MVDDSELDYIRTFLGLVHTAATVKHYPMEAGKVDLISDATYEKILVHPGEIIGQDLTHITKRYPIEILESSEANLSTALENIEIGCEKANSWQTITSWTRPSKWCSVYIGKSEPAKIISGSGIAKIKIYLEVEWSVN